MSPPPVPVFISSTWLDLQPEREAVEAALQRMRETKYAGMEYFGSRDEDTRNTSLAEVDRSQVYVGIFGGRYGSGITEAEYRRVRERKLPCFIYVKDERCITADEMEADADKTRRLRGLKDELHQSHTITIFGNPDDLAAKVTADLHRWLFDEYLAPRLESAVRGQYPRDDARALLAAIRDLRELERLKESGLVLAHGPGSVAAGGDITGSRVTTVGTQLNLFLQRPSLGVPFQVPPLPAHFVPRPVVNRDLKARLLADGPTAGSLVVSAVHGLGGVGKSTLAAHLAHDSEVKERFPDGVLWATLGQQPDLLPLLSGWVQALGDYNFKPLGKEAATSHLRTLLHDKAALLVVDDAWDPAQVPPFLVGGPRCRVVITTRDATIAKAVGATLYDLDVMSPEQALALLAGWLHRGFEGTERDQALLLAKAVGYLPLALELAAAQVADGIRWAELLEDLKAEVARLEALELSDEEVIDEATSKRLSLLSSFYLSLRRLSEPRRQDFAWLGVLPEDVTIVPAIATILWGTDERSARTTLRHLRDKALLLPGIPRPDGTLTYRLHDLLRNVARRLLTAPSRPDRSDDLSGLGLTMRAAHAALLERYWAQTQGGLWHTLTDDGYIYIHLTWHLEQAGQEDKLHALMCEETAEGRNGWYGACERLGQVAGYLNDVDRAWRLAEEAFANRGSSYRHRSSVPLCPDRHLSAKFGRKYSSRAAGRARRKRHMAWSSRVGLRPTDSRTRTAYPGAGGAGPPPGADRAGPGPARGAGGGAGDRRRAVPDQGTRRAGPRPGADRAGPGPPRSAGGGAGDQVRGGPVPGAGRAEPAPGEAGPPGRGAGGGAGGGVWGPPQSAGRAGPPPGADGAGRGPARGAGGSVGAHAPSHSWC